MSRIQELKNHNPHLNKSFIDYIVMVFPDTKPKYVELFTNLTKKKLSKELEYRKNEFLDDFKSNGFDSKILDGLSDLEKVITIRNIVQMIPKNDYRDFQTFIDLYEKNLIDHKDITSINSFEQLNELISLAEIKSWGKELESQVEIVLDNPETGWLLIRPLTYEASKKYGSSTKWCTTQRDTPEYFYRYYKNVLVYCINRKTGYKVAMNHFIHEKETTFWNAKDERIDSIITELDDECRKALLLEISTNLGNRSLTPDIFRIEEEKYDLREREYPVPMITQEHDLLHIDEDVLRIGGDNGLVVNGNVTNVITLNPPHTLTVDYPDWVSNISE